jgi:iron complex outermembrane receptor protein
MHIEATATRSTVFPRRRARLTLVTMSAVTLALQVLPWVPVGSLEAQERGGEPPVLPPVDVRVTRETERSTLELPFAVSATLPDSVRPGQRHISLDETLLLLPGVTVASRHNPTQDPRISIRGFGARSAFGVRGVRVLRDGMPLTLPDGQTPVDYLDLESVGQVEVLRGSASALYGNAAGGVIELRSEEPSDEPLAVSMRGWSGADGFQRWTGAADGTLGPVRYQGTAARTSTDGWRDYSRHRTTHGHARVATDIGATTVAVQALLFDMPIAENPGALTETEWRTDPTTANAASVTRGARKAVTQSQFGLAVTRAMDGGEIDATVYGGSRTLDNPLPFAIIDIDRVSYGASVRGGIARTLLGREHRISAGIDAQMLSDDRRNFANCNDDPPPTTPTADCPDPGRERGVLQLDQRERVRSIGVYLRDEFRLGSRWLLSAGVRADQVRFQVDDHYVVGGDLDDSGARTLRAISPMAGLLVRVGLLNALYANVSTSFETPTATELGNQPDGNAGINRELDPQRAVTYELGAKGVLMQRVRYDIAVFETRVTDELVPFEAPGGGERRFFRNAGRTQRRGVEVAAGTAFGPLDIGASYSFADYEFREYTPNVGGVTVDYSDNRIPGIPQHQLQSSATVRHRSVWATAEAIFTGSVTADDANTAAAPAYEVLHLRAGGDAVLGRPWFAPVIGVHNVLDRRYVSALSINANFARYYEPAPGRTWFVGLTLGYGR